MTRLIAEWFWRAAMVCALGWIGWELHGIREDMMQPVDDDPAVTAGADESQHCLNAVRYRVERSRRKVESIPLAMNESR